MNQRLLDLARELQTVPDFAELVVVASAAMRAETRYRHAWLTLLDAEKQLARVLAGVGIGGAESLRETGFREFSTEGDRMVEAIIDSREPIIIVDARTDPRPNPVLVEALGSRTIINIPLLFDDHTIGCFGLGTLADVGPLEPTNEEMEFLVAMASHMSVVIARLRADERRKAAELQLQHAQRLEALGHLAGGVAHDFNNLLTAIFGNLTLARLEVPDEHGAHEFLDAAEEAANRGAKLSRQLLAFSRRQVVRPEPVDLNQIIGGMQSLLARLLPKTTSIEHLPGHSLGTVLADPGQIEQVILNLVINANDAMEDGGRIVIETENVRIDREYQENHPWARLGRFALLTVTDTGMGMSAEVQERIFEPFFTTKGPERGTGLGLSVVFGVVDQHDGMVQCYSEPGVGTSFKVYLPIVERPAASVGPKIERPVRGGSEHVLVAEDDERVRRVIANTLTQAGYQVSLAENGAQALKVLEHAETPVQLVISDVVMPEMDGARLWKHLRADAPSLPVLIMSGYAANGLGRRFEDVEALRVLTKPFRSSELLRAVRSALESWG